MAVRDLYCYAYVVQLWKGLGADLVTFHSLSISQTRVSFCRSYSRLLYTWLCLFPPNSTNPCSKKHLQGSPTQEPASIGLGLGFVLDATAAATAQGASR